MQAKPLLSEKWAILIAVAATVVAVEIPVRLVLNYQAGPIVECMDWVITFIFLLDLLLHVWCAGWFRGVALPGRLKAPIPYGRWWFVADVAAVIPVWVLPVPATLQLVRLFKLARVGRSMHLLRQSAVLNANLLRLVFFMYWLALLTHCLACGWLALRGLPPEFDKTTHYVRAIYYTVTTLATVGYGDITPSTNPQMLYAMALMILGAGVYGYVIANIASILANIDPAKVRYREVVEKLSAFMRYRNIPPDLQRRILDYNSYLWEKRLGYDESAAIAGLPPSLRSEISLFLNRDIIERVPLFQGASEEFIRAVALEMRPVIFTPGDYIMRAGQPGSEMYFISRGVVEIVSSDGKKVFAKLGAGDFFGEMALLFNQRRTASARALEYCDLHMLEKGTFETILAGFPDFASHIQSVAGQRQEKKQDGNG